MSLRDPQRLRSYVARVTRSLGGPGRLADDLAGAPRARGAGTAESPAEGDPGRTGRKAAPDPALAAAAVSAAGKIASGRDDLTPFEALATEAIIVPEARPAFDIVDGDFVADHALWHELSDDEAIHARLRDAIPCIGRIELPGQRRIPYAGTGFVVGRGLLMTNRHVAEVFAAGLGGRRIAFRAGWRAAVDFRAERGRPDGADLEVRAVRMIHPWWDMALLEVPDLAPAQAPLRLAVIDARDFPGRRIAVIGYPARDPLRNDPQVQDRLFDRAFQVKRLQPGELDGARRAASFGRMVDAAAHDCSTLGGNSGSALIDLDTGEVLGLHFGGRYLDTNHAVPSIELARDPRVVDAGVSFAGAAPGGAAPAWLRAWHDVESGAPDGHDDEAEDDGAPAGVGHSGGGAPVAVVVRVDDGRPGRIAFEVPLRITVELGAPPAPVAVPAPAPAPATEERVVEPRHDTDYRGRGGYDAGFFGDGVRVPMPLPRDAALLAPTKDGGTRLDYQNFSILMHAGRRLALLTAANLTRETRLRRPDPARRYTRKALGGLADGDVERWFEDPRLDSRFQLPDVFFTRDEGSFDKGHLVRREDVAWGADYATLVRANGDTFHVTNCSPQVAQFNQSRQGEDNWGDLENLVFGGAARERLCVFAGPVLDAADETFVGRAAGGRTLRVRIPSRYWKVVVAPTADGIAAYGFVLEQDLSAVDLEFVVPDAFRRLQVPLAAIEEAAGIDFGDVLRAADAWEDEDAQELAGRAGLVRARSLHADASAPEDEPPTPNAGDDEDAGDYGDRTLPPDEAPPVWRVARSLLALRRQVDAVAPRRSKASDGSIGDAAHASRNSDHNPWVRDGTMGVVTAIDITHDPAGGCDAGRIAEAIRTSRDARVKYVIWNRRIASSSPIGGSPAWVWRDYRGSNPHDKHVHVSARAEKTAYDDDREWGVPG